MFPNSSTTAGMQLLQGGANTNSLWVSRVREGKESWKVGKVLLSKARAQE